MQRTEELFIKMIKEGYEIRLVPARTKTGLYHPRSLSGCGIVVTTKPPGLGSGEVYASGHLTYEVLRDPKVLSEVLYALKKRVDKLKGDKI